MVFIAGLIIAVTFKIPQADQARIRLLVCRAAIVGNNLFAGCFTPQLHIIDESIEMGIHSLAAKIRSYIGWSFVIEDAKGRRCGERAFLIKNTVDHKDDLNAQSDADCNMVPQGCMPALMIQA